MADNKIATIADINNICKGQFFVSGEEANRCPTKEELSFALNGTAGIKVNNQNAYIDNQLVKLDDISANTITVIGKVVNETRTTTYINTSASNAYIYIRNENNDIIKRMYQRVTSHLGASATKTFTFNIDLSELGVNNSLLKVAFGITDFRHNHKWDERITYEDGTNYISKHTAPDTGGASSYTNYVNIQPTSSNGESVISYSGKTKKNIKYFYLYVD